MRKPKKRNSFAFKIVLLLIILFLGGLFYINYAIYAPVDENDTENVSVIIKSGTGAKEIGKNLHTKGLIKSDLAFYLFVRLNKADKEIIAGRYLLNKSMNVPEIVATITQPSVSETVITIPEGLTVSQIDDRLYDLGLADDGAFETAVKEFNNYENYWFLNKDAILNLEYPLEGYLYPDTYFVDPAFFTSNDLITKMLGNFDKKFDLVKAEFTAQNRTMHDIITMASILQREVRTQKDFNPVSGILWKRFDSNWHIGADATILYATKKKNISAEDLRIDSPYNTRLYVGMPPGPICNPDIEHIRAAITPEDSDYWYYLTTLDTGEVIYARTNDEHNVNKARYL